MNNRKQEGGRGAHHGGEACGAAVPGARTAGRHAAASLVVALLPGRACVPLGDACLPALGLGWAACVGWGWVL